MEVVAAQRGCVLGPTRNQPDMKLPSKARKPDNGPARRSNRSPNPQWRSRVYAVLKQAGEPLALPAIYDGIEKRYPDLMRGRPNWRARVRATLEGADEFARVASGVWDLRERHSKEAIEAFLKERRERYPLRSQPAS